MCFQRSARVGAGRVSAGAAETIDFYRQNVPALRIDAIAACARRSISLISSAVRLRRVVTGLPACSLISTASSTSTAAAIGRTRPAGSTLW